MIPEVENGEIEQGGGCFDIAALPRHLFIDILKDFDLPNLIALERVCRSMRPNLEFLWAKRSKQLKLYSGKFEKLTSEQMRGLCKRLKNWVEEVVFMPPANAPTDEVKAYRRQNISNHQHYLEHSDALKAISEELPNLSQIDFGFLQLKDQHMMKFLQGKPIGLKKLVANSAVLEGHCFKHLPVGLEILCLHDSLKLSDPGLYMLGERCPNLKFVELHRPINIHNRAFGAMLEGCSENLQNLIITTNDDVFHAVRKPRGFRLSPGINIFYELGLTANGNRAIGRLLKLKVLDLESTDKIVDGKLIAAIGSNCSDLEVLKINGATSRISWRSVESLARLTKLKQLHLSLGDENLTTDYSRAIISISRNGVLEILLLHETKVSDEAIRILFENCKKLNTLEVTLNRLIKQETIEEYAQARHNDPNGADLCFMANLCPQLKETPLLRAINDHWKYYTGPPQSRRKIEVCTDDYRTRTLNQEADDGISNATSDSFDERHEDYDFDFDFSDMDSDLSGGGYGIGMGVAIAELLGGYDSDDGPLVFGDAYVHNGYYFGPDGEFDYIFDDEAYLAAHGVL